MIIEDQLCTLEQAKKLKELGVKQDSYFYWFEYADNNRLGAIKGSIISGEKSYSAFTASELGELLPETINEYFLHIINAECLWVITYRHALGSLSELRSTMIADFNMSNALAKMLIHLIENKLV